MNPCLAWSPAAEPHFNVGPMNQVAAIRETERHDAWEQAECRWGTRPLAYEGQPLRPRPIFCAKAETIDRTPLFIESYHVRRCLVPATGFYHASFEPDGTRTYFDFTLADESPFCFAAVWRTCSDATHSADFDAPRYDCFSIITTEANQIVGELGKKRMPVLVKPEHYAEWLDWHSEKKTLQRLLVALPSEAFMRRKVSPTIGFREFQGDPRY